MNLNSSAGHFEKSWRCGVFQTFTIWVNPFSVITCVLGGSKSLCFSPLSQRTLRPQRLCVRTQMRNLG